MKDTFKELADKWTTLPGTRKSIIIVMSIAVVLAGLFFLKEVTREEYATLFTGLEPKMASAVVEELEQSRIPYQLQGEGTIIMVPKKQVYDIRIQLAGEGLLTNTGLGFELFDTTKLGVTEFERRLDFQRALQEELRRTIAQLEEIEQARVHLVLPERSVFINEDRPASAAVTIALKPLSKLNPEQIKGIVYLVASSVDNLPPENVKLIDSSGLVLSDNILEGDSDSLTQQNLTQYEIRRALEKDLERRVQNMLERVLGLDRVVAMVTAELDFDQIEQNSIIYGREGRDNPADGVILSQQESTEDSESTSGAGNLAGTYGNIGTPNYPGGEQGTETYNRTDHTTNYLVDQTEQKRVQAPGQIRRLSIAVVVDENFDAERRAIIEEIVGTAVGFDGTRGDRITVEPMAFYAAPTLEPLPELDEEEIVPRPLWHWIVLGVGVLILLLVLVLIIRRRKKQEAVVAVPVGSPELEPIPISKVIPEISMDERIRKEKQKKITDIARERPEDAVSLLRAWLSEE